MAKRSDFAQKLLDDLRLRKEQMAASQNLNQSNRTAVDAYAYSKQTHRGTRDTRTQGTITSTTRNIYTRNSRGIRSPAITEASNQIVPYNKGRTSAQIGDLSMALAFALQNGGKHRRADSSGNGSILGFLHQIGRRSFNLGKMERRSSVDRLQPSTSRFPTLSHLHIKEISRGAQKLNQILSACSNGLSFDRYSIEIGQELLKGAMDLEESLRMLVNLQEASEYMISPQRKNRITLLDDDEDDEDNKTEKPEQKQLDLPRFTFDKIIRQSHGIHEVKRNSLRQRLAKQPMETSDFNHEKRALITSKLISYSQSVTYDTDVKTHARLSEQKHYSSSLKAKPENGRISNVIAKLMGLDDIPENLNSKSTRKKDLSTKQKVAGSVLQRTAHGRTKKMEPKVAYAESLAHLNKQKLIEADKSPLIQNYKFASELTKKLPIHNLEAVGIHRKVPWKVEGMKPETISAKTTTKDDKQQSKIYQTSQHIASRQERERKGDEVKHREEKATEKGLSKGTVLKNGLQEMELQKSERTVVLQEKTGYKGSTQIEKRYPNKRLAGNQQKPPNNLGLQQPYRLRKADVKEVKHHRKEREQQSGSQKWLEGKQKGSEMMSKSLSEPAQDTSSLQEKQPDKNRVSQDNQSSKLAIDAFPSKEFPSSRYLNEIFGDGSFQEINDQEKELTNRNSDQSSSPRKMESEFGKAKPVTQPDVKKKYTQVPDIQKDNTTRVHKSECPQIINEAFCNTTRVHKSESPRKSNEAVVRKNGTLHNFARPVKQHSLILNETKQKRHDKINGYNGAELAKVSALKEVESQTVESRKSIASIQSLNLTEELQREVEQFSTLALPAGEECRSPNEAQVLHSNGMYQNTPRTMASNEQDQQLVPGRDEELKSFTNLPKDTDRYSKHVLYHQDHQRSFSKLRKRVALSESESRLKLILITSELFLNIAEALFRLDIPIGIFNVSSHDSKDEESKLTLECGYEIMKRKGKRQELTTHPYTKKSMGFSKIRSLDGLVKQLHKGFETLKFYGRNGRTESELHDYLPKMLESDVDDRNPDLNCMWDLGWNPTMFAFLDADEVVRDVEKHILNGLMDEVTRDLLHL